MRTSRPYRWLAALAAGVFITGCASTGPVADDTKAGIQQIPRISKLCAKATARPATHRFRKPLRDERARLLRQLSAECDRMIANLHTQDVSAEALTGTTPGQQQALDSNARSLQSSLAELATAARRGDNRAMETAHSAALAAYVGNRGG